MSTKHPDVIRTPPSPMECLTLGEMHQARWTMIARCSSCGLAVRAPLQPLIRIYGPDFMWWGYQAPCPGLECRDGRLAYSCQSINGGSWVSMKARPAEQYIEAWKAKRSTFFPGPR